MIVLRKCYRLDWVKIAVQGGVGIVNMLSRWTDSPWNSDIRKGLEITLNVDKLIGRSSAVVTTVSKKE